MGCCGGNNDLTVKLSDPNVDLSQLEPVLAKYKDVSGSLISILQGAQEIFGYLPLEVLNHIAEKTGIKPAKIHGVATFYTQFRLNPVGKYLIMLCQGTACHVNGSKFIEEAICDELKIKEGETTEDGLFTLNNVACLGCCSLSPVMMINGETYAKLTPESTKKILKDIRKKEQSSKEV
ncbi:NADH-quinone oxidoreductase subunit NuoE [Marinisporobacter balticus]|uniref:NADH-quinone oxidoreductase subunit E n=1 Tax=Marinisporobacter balticus TaxID=2018667 RepID=A0A4R2KGR1_9FIRM|nr:NADH-quinone oxidoreductase subunit NuoE [Marinisporobacter balticus]TCO71487.1 NADH-quinone oxidoreductase subunit E [Marinisporobacter balticus]